MADRMISVYAKDGNWLFGTVDEYPFQVKVCDKASSFGINQGRVIKLYVYQSRGQELFAFERGWSKYPENAESEDILEAMLLFCNSLPKQNIWQQTSCKTRLFLVTDGEVLECEDC